MSQLFNATALEGEIALVTGASRGIGASIAAGLAAAGARPPDFADAWDQHRRFAAYAWVAAAFTVGAGGGAAGHHAAALAERTQAAAEGGLARVLEVDVHAASVGEGLGGLDEVVDVVAIAALFAGRGGRPVPSSMETGWRLWSDERRIPAC